MIAHLLRKELREHRWTFLSLAIAAGSLGALTLLGERATNQSLSVFDVYRGWLLLMVPIASAVLSRALIGSELRGGTYQFLEALPISRSQLFTVKLGLGFASLFAVTTLGGALYASIASAREPLGATFISILAARAGAFALVVGAFTFLSALFGRYQVPLWLFAASALITWAAKAGDVAPTFGPLALMDHRFGHERSELPIRALLETLAVAGLEVAATVCVIAVRDGALISALKGSLSHREKVLAAGAIVGVIGVVAVATEDPPKPPYQLEGADVVRLREPPVELSIAPGGSKERSAAAVRLTAELKSPLIELGAFLEATALPPVSIVHRADLDPGAYELDRLPKNEGILVRARFADPRFDASHFTSWLVRRIVLHHTKYRAALEPKRWVLAALSEQRRIAALPEEHRSEQEKRLGLRAIYGLSELRLDPGALLERWLAVEERVGEDLAAAIAWTALGAIERAARAERTESFVRRVLSETAPEGIRAVWFERRSTVGSILAEETGLDRDAFEAVWAAELARISEQLGAELAALPRVEGEVSVRSIGGSSRTIVYRARIAPAPPARTRWTLVYTDLEGTDLPIEPVDLEREEHEHGRDDEHTLPRSFEPGERVYTAFALRIPELGCEVLTGGTRRTLE